jgi:hypothetical protein
MQISCAIFIQTAGDIIMELKKLIRNVIVYRYLPYDDLENAINAFLLTMILMKYYYFLKTKRKSTKT